MSYELKSKYDSIFANLQALRQGDLAQGRAPRDVSLREYMREEFQTGEDEPVDVFMHELGIDPRITRATDMFSQERGEVVAEYVREGIRTGMGLKYRDLMKQANDRLQQSFAVTAEGVTGERWVSPEVFLDPAMRAMIQNAYYTQLVIQEIMVSQLQVTAPRVELGDAVPSRGRTEGATRTVGTVDYKSKQVKIKEFSKGIEITDEALWFNTVDFISIFFRQLGSLLSADLNNECVFVIIKGDQADLSEAAAVIGVDDPTVGFQYKDIARVWVRESTMNSRTSSILGNEDTLLDYLDLPEVKGTIFRGAPLLQTNLNTPLPTEMDAFASIEVPDNQLALEDNSQSVVQLTAKALMIENERSVKKGMNGSYAKIFTGFANVMRHTRVVIDRTVSFGAPDNAKFPAWMDAYRGRKI